MPDEKVDLVVIYAHANYNVIRTDSILKKNDTGELQAKSNDQFHLEDIEQLETKNVETVLLLGCNMGRSDQNNNMAIAFIKKDNNLGVGEVIAADGQICHKDYDSNKDIFFWSISITNHKVSIDSENDGFKRYYYVGNNTKPNIYKIGYEYNNIVELLKAEDGECLQEGE